MRMMQGLYGEGMTDAGIKIKGRNDRCRDLDIGNDRDRGISGLGSDEDAMITREGMTDAGIKVWVLTGVVKNEDLQGFGMTDAGIKIKKGRGISGFRRRMMQGFKGRMTDRIRDRGISGLGDEDAMIIREGMTDAGIKVWVLAGMGIGSRDYKGRNDRCRD
ncbi:E7.6.2.1 [Mytilus coruscus]|uniref:E7.6.2.1 n=1 Tax=Mytilus coruscus TaxID=42192 RepID=A0A6J8D5R8_MYTCO|nr:E7.6.2.1 [Mytilus coruscus]